MWRLARLAVLLMAAGVALTAEQSVKISLAARAIQPGEVVLVSVAGLPRTEEGRVRVFGRSFPLFADGAARHVALVGIDLDVKPGAYTAAIETMAPDGRARGIGSEPLTVRPKSFPTRRLTVEPRYVEPPPSEAARIATESQRLADLWESRSPVGWTSSGFMAPVPDPANSAFGSRSVFNGQARSPHAGADFSSPAGRPIVAPAGGRVVLADDLYFTGQTVVIDHGMGLLSLFAHLSSYEVTEGQAVERGDPVGRVGATGRVTGPHLHWTVRLAGARVDPLSLIAATANRD
jgi:murein DD-endopeptidase MepM/ murein hydrolase activator NlpD